MVQPEDFTSHVGQEITIQGVALRSKAGAFMISGEQEIWLTNYDWKAEEYEKKVRVTGVLTQGTEPLSAFPVATQDENGAWSQGTGGMGSLELQPTISASQSWLLEVQAVYVVDR